MFNWKNKKVFVTGSEGMIGKELVKLLEGKKAKVVKIDTRINKLYDITEKMTTESLIEYLDIDYIFHLAGIKGNPKITEEKPVDFMGPMLQFDTNMILAAQKYRVKRVLYTSSIAVENPESDFYPAWAKMTAEKLIDAMRIQYPEGTKYCIVRPSNVYGKEDLSRDNLMVVSSLIKFGKENKKLILDKKGMIQERDVIHAKDVARGMIKAMEKMPQQPVNLCSGKATKIKDIAEEIAKQMNVKIEYRDLNMVLGPQKKIMSNPYIKPKVTLKQGIKECLK